MNGIMPAIVADLSESHLLPILTFRCRNILLARLIQRSDWHLQKSDVTTIESDLKKALDMLHRCGFLHGNVNEDHVVIDQVSIFQFNIAKKKVKRLINRFSCR